MLRNIVDPFDIVLSSGFRSTRLTLKPTSVVGAELTFLSDVSYHTAQYRISPWPKLLYGKLEGSQSLLAEKSSCKCSGGPRLILQSTDGHRGAVSRRTVPLARFEASCQGKLARRLHRRTNESRCGLSLL